MRFLYMIIIAHTHIHYIYTIFYYYIKVYFVLKWQQAKFALELCSALCVEKVSQENTKGVNSNNFQVVLLILKNN